MTRLCKYPLPLRGKEIFDLTQYQRGIPACFRAEDDSARCLGARVELDSRSASLDFLDRADSVEHPGSQQATQL
jgi:hypothetical protein